MWGQAMAFALPINKKTSQIFKIREVHTFARAPGL
jgi:hypothetical protein